MLSDDTDNKVYSRICAADSFTCQNGEFCVFYFILYFTVGNSVKILKMIREQQQKTSWTSLMKLKFATVYLLFNL